MLATASYSPGQWHEFFELVGTGAVTLTGLVFVAMSLNLRAIVSDATHRNRAINTLTGLSLVFLRCALVVMGNQSFDAIGWELLVVAGISAGVFIRGYAKALQLSQGLRLNRIVIGTTLHVSEMVGAVILLDGHPQGLYVAGTAIVANTCFMITAAWLLVVGALDGAAAGANPRD